MTMADLDHNLPDSPKLDIAQSITSQQQNQEQDTLKNPAHFVGAGLRNLGNSCYLNAALQCLTYTRPLVTYLWNSPHTTPCKSEGFCLFCVLKQHVDKVLSNPREVVSPYNFFHNVSGLSLSARFRKYYMEDAQEYMHCLLEALDTDLLSSKAAAPNDSSLQEQSFVKKMFEGQVKTQITCANCSHCSENLESTIEISLPIGLSNSITEALESFTAEEEIERGDGSKCEKCDQGGILKMRVTIDRAPEVLLIHLKRFIDSENKLNRDVQYSHILDLKSFYSGQQSPQDLQYELYGVLVHSGSTLNSGHYYSVLQTSEGIWHSLNDSEVTLVSKESVLEEQAYVLCYFRRSFEWFSHCLEPTTNTSGVSSPKSVLEESNPSDDFDLSDKVSPDKMHKEKTPDDNQTKFSTPSTATSSLRSKLISEMVESPLGKVDSSRKQPRSFDSDTFVSNKKRATVDAFKSPSFPLKPKAEQAKESPKCLPTTPSSINKVLSTMTSSRRACLLQHINQNNTSYQASKKSSTPNECTGRDSTPSPYKSKGGLSYSNDMRTKMGEDSDSKRQSQFTTPMRGKRCSTENAVQNTETPEKAGQFKLKDQMLNFASDYNPYDLEIE